MGKHSEHSREIALEIRRVKREEAADAIVAIMLAAGANRPGVLLNKKVIFSKVEEQVRANRRYNGCKGITIPTVEHREVGTANEAFCRTNWTEIKGIAESYGYYFIYNPEGEGVGLRLGTIEEYADQQSRVLNSTQAYADWHNRRSSNIKVYGHKAAHLKVRVTGERLKGKYCPFCGRGEEPTE
jgi:hypothetical protein